MWIWIVLFLCDVVEWMTMYQNESTDHERYSFLNLQICENVQSQSKQPDHHRWSISVLLCIYQWCRHRIGWCRSQSNILSGNGVNVVLPLLIRGDGSHPIYLDISLILNTTEAVCNRERVIVLKLGHFKTAWCRVSNVKLY